jgi:hypothetical protein
MIRKNSRLKLYFNHIKIDFYIYIYIISKFRTLNLSVLGIDSEIRIRLNLSNILLEPNRRKADPAFGTKIDIFFPTSFVQFSQAIMVNKLQKKKNLFHH